MNAFSKPHTSGAAMASHAREAAQGAVDSATEALGDAVDRGQAAIRQGSAAAGEMAKSASQQVTTFASELEATFVIDYVEQGAAIIVAMAQLGPDGPTGTFVSSRGPVPW